MSCMCGDICCPSCGPAQGNGKCALCGVWASEGCEHFDDITGDYKPEFLAQVEAIQREDAASSKRYYEDWYEPLPDYVATNCIVPANVREPDKK